MLLKQAVRSALAQDVAGLRVLICDNASGDATAPLIRSMQGDDPRIDYHEHPSNIGAYANFNFGVRAVTTPFFSLLSDDDVLMPGCYAAALQAFERHPGAMFVAMPVIEVDEQGTIIGVSGADLREQYFPAGDAYGKVPMIWTGYVLRREVIEQIGFTNESEGPAADVSFLRHVTARYPGVVLPEIAAVLRHHPGSLSASDLTDVKSRRSCWNAMAERIERDPQIPLEIRTTVRPAIERMYLSALTRVLVGALVDGRRDGAMRAAAIFREAGKPWRAAWFRILIAMHDFVPGVPAMLGALVHRRRTRYLENLGALNDRMAAERERIRPLLSE